MSVRTSSPLAMAKLCFDDPKYWRDMARTERAAAAEDRARVYGTVESIRIHEQNAAEYEARAAALEEADDAEPFVQGPDTQL